MRLALLASLVLVASVACGGYSFPGSSPSPNQGVVTGRVIAVPCAPVEAATDTCTGRPVAGLQLDYTNGSATRAAVTDSAGDYSIRLDAGTWQVHLKTYMRLISGPTSVNVAAGGSAVANYTLDSGIRAPIPPVPQQ